jgi:hypothetical protein
MKNRLAIALGVSLLLGTAAAQEQTTPPTQTPQQTTASPAAQKAPEVASLPAGTSVKMRLETAISTTTSKVGDSFSGRVTQDVICNGKAVIPVGSTVQGRVTRLSEPRRYKGVPTIEMRPEVVTLPNGDKLAIIAVVSGNSQMSTDNEGRLKGSGIDHRDKLEMAAGAGGGAAMGALIAHSGKGALMGAAIGGGAAVVYWLTKSHSATLPPGSEVILELSRAMSITPNSAD